MKKLGWSFLILAGCLSYSGLHGQNPQKAEKDSNREGSSSNISLSNHSNTETRVSDVPRQKNPHSPGIAPFQPLSAEKIKAREEAANRPQQPR